MGAALVRNRQPSWTIVSGGLGSLVAQRLGWSSMTALRALGMFCVAVSPVAAAQSALTQGYGASHHLPHPTPPHPAQDFADNDHKIERLGTADFSMVETTPVVWKGKLLRFESVRGDYVSAQLPPITRCRLTVRAYTQGHEPYPTRLTQPAKRLRGAPD
eukprot:COSAG04_NODE_1237_length_7611_cov_4.313498_10_plen_158_part_01